MKNRIERYITIPENRVKAKKENIAKEYKGYSKDLEMFEKSIKADIHYLTESLRWGEKGWAWVLEALEKKVEGHSQLVDDLLQHRKV